MPLTIPAGDGIASIRFRYSSDVEEMICTLGVRATSGPLNSLHAERVLQAWASNILLSQDDSVSLLGVTLRVRQDGGGDLVYDVAVTGTANGGSTGEGTPPNTAYLVEKRTARGGRRGVGRMFVPGVPEAAVDQAGNVIGASLTSMNTRVEAFRVALGAAAGGTPSQAPVIPLLFHGPTTQKSVTTSPGVRTVTVTEGAAGPAPDVITSMITDPRVATQRRRLR